jgi:hypothetical protein
MACFASFAEFFRFAENMTMYLHLPSLALSLISLLLYSINANNKHLQRPMLHGHIDGARTTN